MSIIGITRLDDNCFICRCMQQHERALNELTMDILLERLTESEIAEKYASYFLGLSGELREHRVKTHALHCDPMEVPDDYVFHPELYEDGETLGERDIHVSPPKVVPPRESARDKASRDDYLKVLMAEQNTFLEETMMRNPSEPDHTDEASREAYRRTLYREVARVSMEDDRRHPPESGNTDEAGPEKK